MDTMELVKAQEQEMIQMRRHIHQNPELSNQEFQTTKLIQEKLTEYGVEIADIGLKTGVGRSSERPFSRKNPGNPRGYRRPADEGADRASLRVGPPTASAIPAATISTPLFCSIPRKSSPPLRTSFMETSCSCSSRRRKTEAAPSS